LVSETFAALRELVLVNVLEKLFGVVGELYPLAPCLVEVVAIPGGGAGKKATGLLVQGPSG
jgi:hypothetical protein